MTVQDSEGAPFQPPAERLRAVTFDLDGLMFNTEELYQQVGGELLARRGKKSPEICSTR